MTHYDLVVIGTGSGNTIVNHRFADWKVAFVERGVFGGTCLNKGCIPTKMFVHTADVAATPAGSARYGVDEELLGVRWPEVRDRIFGRIDPISGAGSVPAPQRERHHVRGHRPVHRGQGAGGRRQRRTDQRRDR
ncbi:hypothetical protein GCM10029976_075460 [Kribbella albertanoniae]